MTINSMMEKYELILLTQNNLKDFTPTSDLHLSEMISREIEFTKMILRDLHSLVNESNEES